jgi:hypothetical protein
MEYTVEVYKRDARTKVGERLVKKADHTSATKSDLKHLYETTWFAKDGYRFEIHETYVTKKNLMGGAEFRERYDTPYFCSPASEAYWSM